MPNPETLTNVNKFVADCKRDTMREGYIYSIMEDDLSGLKEKFRQKARKSGWAHSGHDGKLTFFIHPSDTRWVLCSGRSAYQIVINFHLKDLRENAVTLFQGLQTFPGTLPRPITSWYMFYDRKD